MSERKSTTTTLQALYLMNSEFMHRQTQSIAERWSARSAGRDAFLEHATRTIFGRPPEAAEVQRAESYSHAAGSEEQKRAGLLRAMLASNQFLFAD